MTPKKPHVLFLFSDTGGGHRSSAESIIEALRLEFGDAVSTEMVDFFKGGAPLPFNKMPDWYPDMVKAPHLWGLSFKISDGRLRARAITASMWPYIGRATRALVKRHPADMIVSVHPLATTAFLKALGDEGQRPHFITVVTDMVTSHALWFDTRADLSLVPTEMARQRALDYDMPAAKLRVVGQPIPERCTVPSGTKAELREKLGWPQGQFVVLAVGGGDGMGPLGETARAVADSGLYVGLVIVAGRNEKLKAELESKGWPIPTYIYGFTKDLPDFMRAADVLVTKAGPGTIAESLAAHLPLILYARLPGQEDGNVTYVEETGTGVWAPTPQDVVRTLARWMTHPPSRQKVVENCKQAARPEASRTIARILGAKLGLIPEDKSHLMAQAAATKKR
ncbi:MAG: glycosyltransferase [Anaerolineales bacterium]|nr:glycosyltransferase [Anaerolineales bacterium]